jgi:indole-3-pyruvate monooxygenase
VSHGAIETPTVIVGAGPAGLAVAACLRQEAREFILLEAEDELGSAWRRHYDRLHLHTPKQHSALPGMPMGQRLPEFPSREDVVNYLERYAEAFGIAPHCGERVFRIARSKTEWRWVIDTNLGAYRSNHVVVATGYNHVPVVPSWPFMDHFQGDVIHSREYRNGAPYRGKRVLVVGAGNTGAEITVCLHEHGAKSITLCVRGSLDVVPKKFLGVPITSWAIANARLPLAIQNAITRLVSRIYFGNLRNLGFRSSGKPISRVVREGKIPLIDVGTVDLVREGRVRIVGEIQRFTEKGVVVDEGELVLDAVILATGYRTNLPSLLECADRVLDERGYPRRRGRESELPGLYFVGFTNPPTGLLRSIGIDARKAVEGILSDGY